MLRFGLSLALGHALNSFADVFYVGTYSCHADSLGLNHAFDTAHTASDAIDVSGVAFYV